MSEIRTHEQVAGIIGILCEEVANDVEMGAEERGDATRRAIEWLTATDAFLRAEVERLRGRLDRIDAFAGERCEASGCRHDPCGPVEYHDVEGVPLCAECWQECLDEAAEREERGKEKGK